MRKATPVNQAKLNIQICDERAGGRCECTAACPLHTGRCGARHGHMLPNIARWVRLEAVTRDGSRVNHAPGNLIALCQNCLAAHRKALQTEAPEPEPEPESLFETPGIGTHKETPLL